MPIYEYRCEKGHTFEVMQSMSDAPLANCTVCAAPVQRVFHPVAVHFKGKGFYTTDYGKGASADGKPESTSDSTPDKSESKQSDSKDSKKSESSTKSAAKD